MRARRWIFLGTGKRNCTGRARAPRSLDITIVLVIFSLLASYTAFGVLTGLKGIGEASAQLIPGTQYIGPMSKDFLSLAIGLMPQLQANQLNISNVDGSFKCDLRVPLTYVSSACMSSVSLLVPFTLSNNSQSTFNQSAIVSENLTGSPMALSIGVVSDNVTLGSDQTVSVTVSNESSSMPIEGANVHANITDAAGTEVFQNSGVTDASGQTSFTFTIPTDASAGTFQVDVNATAAGFEPASESTSFEVLSSDLGTFDNSTNDFSSSDGSSSSDGGSSSSSNDDFTSPTVKSTSPSDGDNNVALDTDVTVKFSESIDKNTIDTGSLTVFNLNCPANVITCDPDVQSVSVSGSSATFTLRSTSGGQALLPDTNYEATISSSIEDKNGNFLDCSGSKGVDSNCQWQFSTGKDNTTPTVTSTSPKDKDTNVPISSLISATFSEPVQSSTVTPSSFFVKDSSGTPIPGTISFSSDLRTYTFTPTSLLSGSETYSVTITTGVKDLSGNSLASDKKWSFTTVEVPFAVLDTLPSNGEINVPANTTVAALFSKQLQNSSLTTSTFTVKNQTTNVDGTIFLNSDGRIAIFVPDDNLASSTYTATIKGGSNGVKDKSGGTLSSDFTWSFTTNSSAPLTAAGASVKGSSMSIPVVDNQSNITIISPANQSNATGPLIARNSSDRIELNDTLGFQNKRPLVNTSSSQTHEITPKKSIVKLANGTSIIANNNKIIDKSNHSIPPLTENRTTISPSLPEIRSTVKNTTVVASSIGAHGEKSVEKNLVTSPIQTKSITKQVPLRGTPANSAPLANNDLGVTKENIPVNLKILANDRDGNSDKLKIVGISPPQHGIVISNKNGTLTYIPEKSWAGVDTLSYSVTDGEGGIATGKVVVNVEQKGENHIPTTKSQTVSVMQNNIVRIALQAKDSDGDPLRFIIVSQPSHGRIAEFSGQAGTLIYSPESGYTGRDSFKFKVNDGSSDSNNGKVTVKVQAINDKNTLKNQLLKQNPLQEQRRHQDSSSQHNNINDNSTQKAQEQSSAPQDNGKTASSDNDVKSNNQEQVKDQSKSTNSDDNSHSNDQEQTNDQSPPQQQEEPKTDSTDNSNNQPSQS